MRRVSMGIWLFVVLGLVRAAAGGPGSVEILFTPTVVTEAVALKDGLKIGRLESSNALSLVGVSADRRKAYIDKVAGVTTVVIIGEDALKAVADLEFSSSVVVVNATGPTASKGRVVRVFDGSSAPADAVPVSSASAVKDQLVAGKEVSFKGRATTVVQGVVDAYK